MLILNHEAVIENEEVLELLLDGMHEKSYNEITEDAFEIFKKYLYECYAADVRLTEMTQEKLGEDICPLVFIDCGECDDLNAFNFSLASFDENRKIKLMEEKTYYNLCDICFGHIEGLFNRIYLHFQE